MSSWEQAIEAVHDLPLQSQPEAFAELAESIAEQEPERARRLVVQGLLIGIGPRILAVATRLNPRVGPVVLERFLEEILATAATAND